MWWAGTSRKTSSNTSSPTAWTPWLGWPGRPRPPKTLRSSWSNPVCGTPSWSTNTRTCLSGPGVWPDANNGYDAMTAAPSTLPGGNHARTTLLRRATTIAGVVHRLERTPQQTPRRTLCGWRIGDVRLTKSSRLPHIRRACTVCFREVLSPLLVKNRPRTRTTDN